MNDSKIIEYDNSVFVVIGPYLLDFLMGIKIFLGCILIHILYPYLSAGLYDLVSALKNPVFLNYEWDMSRALRKYFKELAMSDFKDMTLMMALGVSFPFVVNQLTAIKMLWANYFSNPIVDSRSRQVIFFNYIVFGMILVGVPTVGTVLFFVDDVWLKSIYLTWGIVPYLFFYYLYQPISRIAGVLGFLTTAFWFLAQA